MRYQKLLILLSCHSLEDFPVHHVGDEAESLLSNWIGLWHPNLIHAAGVTPTWGRADAPPDDCSDMLIVVPRGADSNLPTGFVDRVKDQGGFLVQDQVDRNDLLKSVLEPLDRPVEFDERWIQDFLALGYAYLQIQLMTRHLRYSSNLDQTHFDAQVLAAVNAAAEADAETAEKKLQSAFDLLSEERNRYYPADALLIDLTLVAETTLGNSLGRQLEQNHPVNYLVRGELLEALAATQPAHLESLKEKVESGAACIVGGTTSEAPWPLLSIEAITRQFNCGRQAFRHHLGTVPRVFGRHRFGLTTVLPQLLSEYGYAGAIHTSFDDGRCPESSQVNICWESPDGKTIDAIGSSPTDASLPETFLRLGISIGEAIDVAHSASLLLTHWPGRIHPCFSDLIAMGRYGNILGQFVSLEDYFSMVSHPGYNDTYNEDQYQTPYHRQAIIRKQSDPISRWAEYWKREFQFRALAGLDAMLAQLGNCSGRAVPMVGERLDVSIESFEPAENENRPNTDFDSHVATVQAEIVDSLVAATRSANGNSGSAPADGVVVFNPCSFPRRMRLEAERSLARSKQDEIYMADEVDGRSQLIVDCPAMGWVNLTAEGKSHANPVDTKKKKPRKRIEPPPIASENLLRNEFFELEVDRKSGGIHSLHLYQQRGNLLSQRLALRDPGRGRSRDSDRDPGVYSQMVCDKMEIETASRVLGRITTSGRLLQGDEHVANFRQSVSVTLGQRVFELDVELEPLRLPVADPWKSYYCSRLAWHDEMAELYRAVNDSRHFVGKSQISAPVYVEIVEPNHRIALFSDGLPFHQKQNRRILDTLLIPHGESRRQFRLGVGVNVPHPMQAAIGFATPLITAPAKFEAPISTSDWQFHLSSRNVIATSWEGLQGEDGADGVSVRFKETEGRAGQLKLTCARPVKRVRRIRLDGSEIGAGEIQEGVAVLDFQGHDYWQVELYW